MTGSVEHLVELCRQALGAEDPVEVRLLRSNLGKTMFELEHRGRSYIGKCSKTHKRAGTFELMRRVREAGMRPPSRFVIVEPVAWFEEHGLLLHSKAEGANVLDLVKMQSPRAMEAMEHAAGWLHAMQRLEVDLPPAPDLVPILDRCCRELHHPRASALLEEIRDRLRPPSAVPAHGDFHPQNVFITSDGLTTAIDLDTLSMREPAFDVAWFQAQLATMGYHKLGSFQSTAGLRKHFRRCAPEVPDDRVRLHIRFALIRSLHYDLCILKLKNRDHVEPFLDAAEHGREG